MSRIHAMVLLLVLLAAGSAHAQSPTGSITGVVTDPAGAVVAGARVTVANHASGLRRNLITSDEGDYLAAALPPGDYRVTAESGGMSPVEQTATVQAGATTTVNLQLTSAGISEALTI